MLGKVINDLPHEDFSGKHLGSAIFIIIPSRDLNHGPKTLTILEFQNEVLDHSATMAWFENTFEIIGGKHLEENLM